MEFNYAAILKYNDSNKFLQNLEALQNQKFSPSSYFIVSSKSIPKEEIQKISNKLNNINKYWKLKISADVYNDPTVESELTEEQLIDEFFSTKTIKNNLCLYVNGQINNDLSEKIITAVKECGINWMYKVDGNEFFHTILCDFIKFPDLEPGIIEAGHSNKIHNI